MRFGAPMRRRFGLEPGVAFLNHGSFGAVPRAVSAAEARWRARMEANPDAFLRWTLPRALRASAAELARFLRARGEDTVFVENATAGVNAVLRSVRLRPGDEVLATSHVYGAVRQAIREACARSGARAAEARIELPAASSDSLAHAVTGAFTRRTRLLVLDHVASPTGLVFPVRRIAAAARRRGIRVLVDGAHAPGQLPLDVPGLGADWYAGNCHKWLFAARGCGFLWARPSAQAGLHPTSISHGYGRGLAAEFDWTGTRDFSPWLALPEALRFHRALGTARMRAWNHRLATGAAAALAAAWGTRVDAPPALHGAMAAVRLPDRLQGRDAPGLMESFYRRSRVIAAVAEIGGELWARISAQVYNAPGDYARLDRAVRRAAASARSTPAPSPRRLPAGSAPSARRGRRCT